MNDTTEQKAKFCTKSEEGTTVSFTFGNGVVLSLDVATLEEEVQTELMLHGALQKIGDSYAGAAGDFDYAISNATRIINNLVNNVKKVAGAKSTTKRGSSELVEAIARLKSISIQDASAAVDALPDDQKKVLRGLDAVKSEIAKIRAERAQARLDKAKAALQDGEGTPSGASIASILGL